MPAPDLVARAGKWEGSSNAASRHRSTRSLAIRPAQGRGSSVNEAGAKSRRVHARPECSAGAVSSDRRGRRRALPSPENRSHDKRGRLGGIRAVG